MPAHFWEKSGAIASSHQALLIGIPMYCFFLALFEISRSLCTRLYDGPYYEAGLKL
jgi:hypothetical protein